MSEERSKVKRWKHKCAEKESSEDCDSDSTQAGSPPPAMSTSRGSVKRAAAVAAATKLKMSKSSLYDKAYKEDFKRKATEPVKAEEFESLSSPIKGQEKKVLEQMSKTSAAIAKMAKIGAQKRAVIESDGSSSDDADALEVKEEVKTDVVVSSDDDVAASEGKASKRIVESDSDKENLAPGTEETIKSLEAEKKELAPTPAVKEKAEEELVYANLPADVKEKAEEVVKQVMEEVAMSDLAVDEQAAQLLMYNSRDVVVKALLAKKNDADGVAAHMVDQMESVGEGHLSLGLLELVRETVVNCLKGIDGGDVWLPEDEEEATKSEGSSAEAEAKKADDEKSEK